MVKVKAKHRKKYVVLPVSLLVFNIIHEIIVYKSKIIPNPLAQTLFLMVMFMTGFAFVGFVVSPVVVRFTESIYLTGKKGMGVVGEIAIVILFFLGLYYLYFQVYTSVNGVEQILPSKWHNRGPSVFDSLGVVP